MSRPLAGYPVVKIGTTREDRDMVRTARKNKYGNKPVWVDSIHFASKAEAKKYAELKMLKRCGHINELHLQPRFKMVVAGVKICTYVADFSFLEESGRSVALDVKGIETPVFKLKAKLFRALYPDWELRVVK